MDGILNELKEINLKVDLLSVKADNNYKMIETIKEDMNEVRKNITHLDSNMDEFRVVKNYSLDIIERFKTVQNDVDEIKSLEQDTKEIFSSIKINK